MSESLWDVSEDEAGLQLVLSRIAERRAAGDMSAVAYGQLRLAYLVKWVRSDNHEDPFTRSHTLAMEALTEFRQLGDIKGQINALRMAVPLAGAKGAEMLAEAKKLAEGLGDELEIARTIEAEARKLGMSDPEEAKRLYGQALETFRRLGNESGQASCMFSLAISVEDRHDKIEMARGAATLFRKLGDLTRACHAAGLQYMYSEDSASNEELEELAQQILKDAQAAGSRLSEQSAYGRLAKLAAARGDAETHARYLRWEKSLEESDGLTPEERRKEQAAFTKMMAAIAKKAGHKETAKMFAKQARQRKK